MNETGDNNRRQPRTDGGHASESSESAHGPAPKDVWRADRPDDPESLDTLWIRWTDGGSDLHFHRICEIIPQVERSDSWPYLKPTPEGEEPPTFRPVSEGPERSEPVRFKFLTGLPRQILRYAPLVILLATVAIFAGPELVPTLDVNGLTALLPEFTGPDALLFGLFIAIVPLLGWLLGTVGVIESREFPHAVIVYGLIGVLGIGVLISLYLVTTAEHPSQVEPNVVLTSGYLLTLLLGAMLLYEAVLRIEHMFVKLGERSDDIVDNPDAYRQFLTDLNAALNENRIFRVVPPSRLFGVLFAAQFLIVWTIGWGPQNLNYTIGLAVNFLLNAVLVTIVFKFFVLVRYFNKLLNENKTYSEIGLHYEPFHVDGYGGFRDFGQFATRINLILSLAGLYLVYRLYIIGGLKVPMDGISGFTDPLVLTIWLLSFIGPVVAYGFGAAAWGYYSFWSIHSKMERDKRLLARQYQGPRGAWELDRAPSAGDTIDSFEDSNGPEWGAFRDAPTWPLDVNKMMSLLSGNAIPLVLPVVNLFL